jgi:adenylate cyclase
MDPGRERAVLFAELIGADELYGRAGDTAAHDVIAHCAARLGRAAASCDGKLVKTTGYRLMLLTPSADAAARAATAMQVAAGEFPAIAKAPLALGVGFHYGSVIQDKDDVFGDTVNLAARLVEQAASGQILFAAETATALSPAYRRLMRVLYSIPLKGRSEEVALCELVWRADTAATFLPLAAARPLSAKLTLKYRGAKLKLRHGREVLTIGREDDCGLVLADTQASRHHCTIQRRNDHYVLVDRSTNGTYVTVDGEGETRLEHGELVLRRRGWISFGCPRGKAAEAVEFVCD